MNRWLLRSLVVISFFISCASYIPEREMSIAEAAIKAAREANAPLYAPRLFQKAEASLRSAERAREEREFELMKEFALQAKTYAERAENLAVLKKERERQ